MIDDCGALVAGLDLAPNADGPLRGLRFVAKDNIDLAGFVTGNGHPAFAATHGPAVRSAPVVQSAMRLGARLVGKAQMDEMAYSLLGANIHYGTPRNPAAPSRHPGGSSSGSAAAVAVGLADFALGTDTAGSCRAPAAFCGIFGFRPSHGILSMDGVVPLAPSLDVIGWFARDAATLSKVGEAFLPQDGDAGPLSKALTMREAFASCPPAEAKLFRDARDALSGGLCETDCALDDAFFAEALKHFRNLQAFEAHESHGAWIEAARPQFSPGVAERFAYAAGVTLEQKREADEFRERARKDIDAILGADGFFLLPTAPFFPPRLDESAQTLDKQRYQMIRLFLIASFFGLPQVALPLKGGEAPLGLSLIGRRFSDRALLTLAQKIAADHPSTIAETRRP